VSERDVDLVTFGETMIALTSSEIVPLRHASSFRMSIGGAESNVAIGVVRLGHRAAWMGRVGADEFGALVLSRLRGESVDVSAATTDERAPTGLMIRGFRAAGVVDVVYYRRGSAAAHLAPAHLDHDRIRRARVLHVTGITPALGPSAAEAVLAAIETARSAGTVVCFDPNYRSRLWSPDEAARCFREIIPRVDVVLAGLDEAELIYGDREPKTLIRAISRSGPRQAVVKLGGEGAVGVIDEQEVAVAGRPATVVDPVGAGDGFAAGYISALLKDEPAAARLAFADRVAGFVVRTQGDWEGLPSAHEVSSTSVPTAEVRR
jgi:2-dehydro-3-deoxygluconokinase